MTDAAKLALCPRSPKVAEKDAKSVRRRLSAFRTEKHDWKEPSPPNQPYGGFPHLGRPTLPHRQLCGLCHSSPIFDWLLVIPVVRTQQAETSSYYSAIGNLQNRPMSKFELEKMHSDIKLVIYSVYPLAVYGGQIGVSDTFIEAPINVQDGVLRDAANQAPDQEPDLATNGTVFLWDHPDFDHIKWTFHLNLATVRCGERGKAVGFLIRCLIDGIPEQAEKFNADFTLQVPWIYIPG
ncbi:hypothetical protein B0H13DRAFT_1857383 [Mycena leptocephala]|nr:hypothetical protein B0H13DRAFT_1857383 [Mycena leptocephala]